MVFDDRSSPDRGAARSSRLPSFASGAWALWLDGARAAAENMAVDEALLRTALRRPAAVLRFYRWAEPAVTIGYMQAFGAAPESGYRVIRRPTGGGVVFHDRDLTYSIACPPGHPLERLDRMGSYNAVNRAVCEGLRRAGVPAELTAAEIGRGVDRRTMVCFAHPTRYDVMAAGRKVAGSAQRRTPDGLLHQGSIQAEGGLPLGFAALTEALRAGFESVFGVEFELFSPTSDLLELAETLVREKYGTEAWNRRR